MGLGKYAEPEVKTKANWPPPVGIWAAATRRRALRVFPLKDNEELFKGNVPKPGISSNGLGFIGDQVLPRKLWDSITIKIALKGQHEDGFMRGGKTPVMDLGNFQG